MTMFYGRNDRDMSEVLCALQYAAYSVTQQTQGNRSTVSLNLATYKLVVEGARVLYVCRVSNTTTRVDKIV